MNEEQNGMWRAAQRVRAMDGKWWEWERPMRMTRVARSVNAVRSGGSDRLDRPARLARLARLETTSDGAAGRTPALAMASALALAWMLGLPAGPANAQDRLPAALAPPGSMQILATDAARPRMGGASEVAGGKGAYGSAGPRESTHGSDAVEVFRSTDSMDRDGADFDAARPPGLSLTEFLALVRRESPALQADRSLVDMARADLRTASTLPNPALSHARGAGDRQTTIEQALPVFGQRGLRMEGAQRGIDSARANVDALAADALRGAAETFVTLLAAQERTQRWQAANEALAAAAVIVEGQVAAGARSRYDLARIRVEAAHLGMRLDQAATAEADASAQLAATVGATGWRPRAIGSLRPAVGNGDFAVRWDRARTRLPAVRAALASEELARTLVAVERREAWPTPRIGVGRLRDGEGRHALVGVSVEIPLFDRREGPIARARAVADESRQRRCAVILAAEAELGRSVDQFQRLHRLTERFEADSLAALPALERMARDAYQLGRGSILELIDALLAGAEKRIAHVELVESVLKAEVAVRAASGELGIAVD